MEFRVKILLLSFVLMISSISAEPLKRRLEPIGLDKLLGVGPLIFLFKMNPHSVASRAGLKIVDELISINGVSVDQDFDTDKLEKSVPQGGALEFVVKRKVNGVTETLQLPTVRRRKARRIRSKNFSINYYSFELKNSRYRLLTHSIKKSKPKKILLLLGGIGCYTIDTPEDYKSNVYWAIARSASRQGYRVVWVEKPGMGDNNRNGKCQEYGFHNEYLLYKKAVKFITKKFRISTREITIFGHSMGGVFASRLNSKVPFEKVIVMGTLSGRWYDYDIRNTKRQLLLSGMSSSQVNKELSKRKKAMTLLLKKKLTPTAITKMDSSLEENLINPESYPGYTFFQELQDYNIDRSWRESKSPVYAIYGNSDFVTSYKMHQRIGLLCDNLCKVMRLNGLDHFFLNAESKQESFQDLNQASSKLKFSSSFIRRFKKILEL